MCQENINPPLGLNIFILKKQLENRQSLYKFLPLLQMIEISPGIFITRDTAVSALQVRDDGSKMARILTRDCFTLQQLTHGTLSSKNTEGLTLLDMDVVNAILGM